MSNAEFSIELISTVFWVRFANIDVDLQGQLSQLSHSFNYSEVKYFENKTQNGSEKHNERRVLALLLHWGQLRIRILARL